MTKDEALRMALEALEKLLNEYYADTTTRNDLEKAEAAITAVREALAQPEQCQCPACKIAPHASDCPVHNEPAWPNGPCDCGAQPYPDNFIDALKYDVAKRDSESQDNTYNYAKNLAEAIFKQHFASDEHYASGRIVWGVNDTVIGILTQIDNMVADMVRRPAQQQDPVAWATQMGEYAHIKWGAKRPEYPMVYEIPLYTAPPQRKPLTDEQWQVIADTLDCLITRKQKDAIEAVIGIKE